MVISARSSVTVADPVGFIRLSVLVVCPTPLAVPHTLPEGWMSFFHPRNVLIKKKDSPEESLDAPSSGEADEA